MGKLTGHFFYSEKQFNLKQRTCGVFVAKCKLSNGKIATYTEMTNKPKPSGTWDDYVYLGTGEVYSVNGVIQNGGK
jgi:hypothetical protein